MTDNERIKKLEAQIKKLETKQAELSTELAEARLDQWKGRLEDLEVQAHLGAMDTNDRVVALVQQARDRWNDARGQLGDATSAAGDVVETLRGGI
jgi:chromosome segregation ATPase